MNGKKLKICHRSSDKRHRYRKINYQSKNERNKSK